MRDFLCRRFGRWSEVKTPARRGRIIIIAMVRQEREILSIFREGQRTILPSAHHHLRNDESLKS